MTTYVLVPGFWLGGWAWDEVADDLRRRGHTVHQVTLTGLAERAAEATPEVGLETHIADITACLDDHDLHDVVLVAHSGGAWPATGASDRQPDRLRRVVYVDSGPVPHGMAQIDFLPDAKQATLDEIATKGNGWLLPVPAFDPAADPVNLAGLSDEQLRWMRERATPQPSRTATEGLTRPATIPPLPRSAIVCTFGPEQVRAMVAGGVPAFALMADVELHHLSTGHWPMFSKAAELAVRLDKID